jgi:Ni/Fe-hydrogenase subunit HybB-like protein
MDGDTQPGSALRGPTVRVSGIDVPLDPRVVVGIVVAEARAMPPALQRWLLLLAGVMAVSLVAAFLALPPGWEVLGTTPTVEWGLLIAGYVGFAIMTSGLCLASSLGTVFGIDRFRPLERRHVILAVLSLTAAFGIIVLDLHFPIRLVFGAVLSPSPASPMWWMGVAYGAYFAILLVETWSMFTRHAVIHQWACTAAAVMAVIAPTTLGAVFAVIGAKAMWNGIFTPALMLASAFLAGSALLSFVLPITAHFRRPGAARTRSHGVPALRLLLAVAVILVGALVTRQLVAGLDSDVRGFREATLSVVSGPFAPAFWGLRVVIGFAVPAVLLLLPWTRGPLWLSAAGAAALLGVFADRIIFVIAGQATPVTAASGTVTYGFAVYLPSPVEVLIVLGAAAFVAAGYTLAERYHDLGEDEGQHAGYGLAPVRRWVRARLVAARDRLAAPLVAWRARRRRVADDDDA